MVDNFQFLVLLGMGIFGEVWVVKFRKYDEKCVVKVINIFCLLEWELDQVLIEVLVLGRMYYVNIVCYFDVYVYNGVLNIVMEYVDGGKCYRVLQSLYSY